MPIFPPSTRFARETCKTLSDTVTETGLSLDTRSLLTGEKLANFSIIKHNYHPIPGKLKLIPADVSPRLAPRLSKSFDPLPDFSCTGRPRRLSISSQVVLQAQKHKFMRLSLFQLPTSCVFLREVSPLFRFGPTTPKDLSFPRQLTRYQSLYSPVSYISLSQIYG